MGREGGHEIGCEGTGDNRMGRKMEKGLEDRKGHGLDGMGQEAG